LPVAFSFPLNGILNQIRLQVDGFEDLLAGCTCFAGTRRNCLNADRNSQPCKNNIVTTRAEDIGFLLVPVGGNPIPQGYDFQSAGPIRAQNEAGTYVPYGADLGIIWETDSIPNPVHGPYGGYGGYGGRRRLLASPTPTRTRTRTRTRACDTGSGCFSGGTGNIVRDTANDGAGVWNIVLVNFCLYRYYDITTMGAIGRIPFPNAGQSECLGRWNRVVITANFDTFCQVSKQVAITQIPYTESVSGVSYPGYSHDYCSWTLESPPGSTMIITLTNAHGPNGGSVYLNDGPDDYPSPLLLSITEATPVSRVQTTSNIAFLTRWNYWGFGLSVSYVGVPSPTSSPTPTLDPSLCKGYQQITASSPSPSREVPFMSNVVGYNYVNKAYCSWLITAPANQLVRIRFTRFATEYLFDFVTVYDGDKADGRPIFIQSGNLPTAFSPVIAKNNSAFVTFTSDVSVTSAGFSAIADSVPRFTPTNRPITPSRRPITPSRRSVTPSKRPVTPSKRPVTPSRRPVTPSKRPVTPSKRPL